MIISHNTVSERLSASLSKFFEFPIGVAYVPDNSCGRYFIVNVNNEPTRTWYSLGWSRKEAENWIPELIREFID